MHLFVNDQAVTFFSPPGAAALFLLMPLVIGRLCKENCSANIRLNMELDFQSLFGLQHTAVLALRSRNLPLPPQHLGSYSRALWVSHDNRRFCRTASFEPKKNK